MLGFIVGRHSCGTHFLPSSSFRPSSGVVADCRCCWCPLDARHGRILLFYQHDPEDDDPDYFDPGCWPDVPSLARSSSSGLRPPVRCSSCMPNLWLRRSCYGSSAMAAALLCGVPGCDHMECPSSYGPFSVLLVCGDNLGHFTYASRLLDGGRRCVERDSHY